MYVASLPFFLSDYVQVKLENNGNGGRPHILKLLAKTCDAHNEVLNICEKSWIQNHSCRSIAGHYRRKGYKVGVSTIFRIIQDLEPFKDMIVKFLQTTPRRKMFYTPKLDWSDYETIQRYIRRARRDQLRNYPQRITTAKRCWKALGFKDPQNWTVDEVLEFINTLPHAMQSNMVDAIRQVAPQFKDRDSPNYLATGRFREQIRRRKKAIFGEGVKLIHECLEACSLDYEKTINDLHITLGAREGSVGDQRSGMCGLTWDRFKNGFTRVDLFESKVRGGIWSNDCPVDLFFLDLPARLRKLWKKRGRPTKDKLIIDGYKGLTAIYQRINKALKDYYQGKLEPHILKELSTLKPHDSDKIHCNLLWEAGVPIEIVAGEYMGQGQGVGLMGRIWLDVNTIKKHYLTLTARSERFQNIRQQVTNYSRRFNDRSKQSHSMFI